MAAEHIGVEIARLAEEVYAFAVELSNLPLWASGLGGSGRLEDGRWVVEGPLGRVSVAFVPRNEHLVLDHDVTLPTGEVVRNALRVLADGERCDVVFSLRRAAGISDEAHAQDAATIRRDLETLKRLVEAA